MSASEFAEWVAYSRLEPFGERRADQRAWLAVAAMGNLAGGGKANLAQVLPEWVPPDPPDLVARQIDQFFRIKMAADAAKGGT